MARFSIGAAWDEAIGFLRRESGILAPVSMATFGVGAILLSLAIPEGVAPGTKPVMSSHVLLVVPAMLALMLGNLAVSLIALNPGVSVAESLRRAGQRLPYLIAATMLLVIFLFCALILVSLIATPFAGNVATAMAVLTPIVAILLIVFAAPSLLLPPIVAMEPVSPFGALRRVWALGQGNLPRIFAVLCLGVIVMMTMSLIATLVITVVSKLLVVAIGQPALVALIGDIILAGISALMSLMISLYVAFAYRQLAG